MYKLLASLAILCTTVVNAACPQLYPYQQPIPTSSVVVELCNSFYVAQFDQSLRTTIITSERLQPGTAIGSPTRLSSFREDSRVRNSPTNGQYKRSNFDKGHLVPAEDASTDEQMYDTFFLTNIVPQNPTLNRGEWKKLEAKLRASAVKSQVDTYIVTIPIYQLGGDTLGDIPIPTGFWKIMISSSEEQYWFALNQSNAPVQQGAQINWRNLIRSSSTQ
jgi:endonuclease G